MLTSTRLRCIALSTTLLVVGGPTDAGRPSAQAADNAPAVVEERLVVSPLAPLRQGDQPVAILHLYNPAKQPAKTEVKLLLDGQPHATQHVIVPPGARLPITFPLYVEAPKPYRISTGKLSTNFELFPSDLPVGKQREIARQRRRRIIYNNDGGDALYTIDTRKVLDVSTTGLAGSHVDTISYCTVGGLTFWHDSKVGQIIDRGAFDGLKKTLGKDPLELQIDFARCNGIEVFWSMRMNDTHDRVEVWNWMMPQWKRDRPQYMVGNATEKYPWGEGSWSALDYSYPEVRDYIFEIIEDVARRYDVDGIELDFNRGEPYFREQLVGEQVTDDQRRCMTELMRTLHSCFERVSRKRNRPLLLAVRVPNSLAYCRDIGLDLEVWLQEELVDLVVAGGDRCYEPWENMVQLGHRFQRPVYACLAADYLTTEESDWEARWRGHALQAWRSGADGVYTFNFLRHHHPLFRQMGDPAVLEGTETLYEFASGTNWGALKGEKNYIHAVNMEPPGGPFADRAEITLTFPPGGGYEIRYTTDGSEPTRTSTLYRKPITISNDTLVQARAFGPDGVATPVTRQAYRRVKQHFASSATTLPLDFFGLPNGTEMKATFELPQLDSTAQPALFLSMRDVDQPEEAKIFINGGGPLRTPSDVVSGSMVRDGYLPVPIEMFRPGQNTVTFQFDNLKNGTSGFMVYRVEIVSENREREPAER